MREKCVNFNRCGPTGHYWNGEKIVRCDCLKREIQASYLGLMNSEDVLSATNLEKLVTKNARIEGSISELRRHIARVCLNLRDARQSWMAMDAYRLIEIFLEKDEELATQTPALEVDLLILLLGFGDPRNKYLPELVLQVLSRRELLQKPTWVLLGIDYSRVAGKYSVDLANKIKGFQSVSVS